MFALFLFIFYFEFIMKPRISLFLIFILFNPLRLFADNKAPIDTVYSFTKGKDQNIGQDSVYFPANIFKIPTKYANPESPASSPEDICSLGLDGEIIVGFKDYFVSDGIGADFIVFENVFYNSEFDRYFVEPAIVSVSEDGEHYYEFPHDTATLIGCAGITPTNGSSDVFNPDSSGGDKFDLATLGLTRIKYIKIKDISKSILQNPHHKYYDPLISGFDLDCVIGLNLVSNSNAVLMTNSSNIQFNETPDIIEISSEGTKEVSIYSSLGSLTFSKKYNEEKAIISKSDLPNGACFLVVKSGVHIYRKALLN